MTLLEQVRSTISNYHMLGRGDRVAAGVSGGADSVCLLRVLGELRQEYGLTLSVIHVHHGIRGAEADRDARFTEELCRKLAIPCQVIYKDIPALAASERCSEEEMGRAVRYEALMEYAVAHDCNRIAVAHNRDDHAETVIGNLCRGSGIGGLTGIPPVRDRIIRPLLFCGRAQIEEYLAELGQDYCDDSTNAGDAYTRNRIRHQVLPLLETAVNKKSTEHIIETAEQLRQVEEYLTERTGEQLERILWSCPSEAELAGRAGQNRKRRKARNRREVRVQRSCRERQESRYSVNGRKKISVPVRRRWRDGSCWR